MVETKGHSKVRFASVVASGPSRDRRWNGGLRVGSCAILLLTGCGFFDGDSHGPQVSEGTAISSDGIIVCPYGGLSPNPWYSVTAMNNKLRHFPDFASTTGLSAVRSCEDGRQFMQKYREYAERFPAFDQDEPLEESNFPEPAPPTDEELFRAMGSGPKIRNGTAEGFGPVVYLDHQVNPPIAGGAGGSGGSAGGAGGSGGGAGKGGAGGSGGSGSTTIEFATCTGSFIARNFIMTAAHCLQVDPLYQKGVGTTADARLEAFYDYGVEFIGADGKRVRRLSFLLRQYMDPRYVGYEPGGGSYFGFDFALLYFLNSYDAYLPPMDPSATGERFPLIRLSLANGIKNFGQAYFWGTGSLNEDVPPAPAPQPNHDTDAILRKGSLASYQSTFKVVTEKKDNSSPVVRKGTGKFFEATLQSSQGSTAPAFCKGDSGGPLVERWTVRDERDPTIARDVYVAVGVASHTFEPAGTPCTSDSSCSGTPQYACHPTIKRCYDPNNVCVDQPGERMRWTPIFQEAEFIKDKIRRWAPKKCAENFRVTQPTPFDPITVTKDKFLKCWGAPCVDECKDPTNPLCCGEKQYCSRPGSDLVKQYGSSYESSCAVTCGSGKGCSCIYGQCLDGPVFDPTGEGGASGMP